MLTINTLNILNRKYNNIFQGLSKNRDRLANNHLFLKGNFLRISDVFSLPRSPKRNEKPPHPLLRRATSPLVGEVALKGRVRGKTKLLRLFLLSRRKEAC